MDSGLSEPLMSISETADLLGTSLANIVDLSCRDRAPLPATPDGQGGVGFYRSDVECWQAEQSG